MDAELDPNSILIDEHKIIQKMIYFLKKLEVEDFKDKDLFFLDLVINFFHIFADKNHHGKEEEVLFKRVRSKLLKTEEIDLLDQLIDEHRVGRNLVAQLEKAKNNQDLSLLKEIICKIIELYSDHIKKENTVFFPIAFGYFSDTERESLGLNFLKVSQKVLDNQYLEIAKNLLHFFEKTSS